MWIMEVVMNFVQTLLIVSSLSVGSNIKSVRVDIYTDSFVLYPLQREDTIVVGFMTDTRLFIFPIFHEFY